MLQDTGEDVWKELLHIQTFAVTSANVCCSFEAINFFNLLILRLVVKFCRCWSKMYTYCGSFNYICTFCQHWDDCRCSPWQCFGRRLTVDSWFSSWQFFQQLIENVQENTAPHLSSWWSQLLPWSISGICLVLCQWP